MDFDLSDEQRMLKDSVDRLVEDLYGDFERRQGYRAAPEGWSRAIWAQLAGLGLLGLPFAEADGGLGGGPIELMTVMEAFGRGLVVEPYLATVVFGGAVLRQDARAERRTALVERIAEGDLTLAVAATEPRSRYDLADVASTAKRHGDRWVVQGEKHLVLHGDSAGLLVVPARTSGRARDRHGITLFAVDPAAPGLLRRGYATQDGLRAADLLMRGVELCDADVLGPVGGGWDILEDAADAATAAVCSEAVGAMEALQKLTVDYLKTRKQFGVAIGSFQAIQHRAAEMMIAVEQARSMALYATMMMRHDEDRAERRNAIAAAKLQINRSARFVGQEAVQLHGGVGMTMEYRAGHYFKRLSMIELQFGDSNHHLSRLVASQDAPPAPAVVAASETLSTRASRAYIDAR